MLEHHIQKDILRKLVTSDVARYSDLKPKTIDGNIFTYHLQQLMKQQLIAKTEDGSYTLTSKGKALGINSHLSNKEVLQQAHAILLLAVEVDGKWLLRRRLAQPTYGKIGFVHGEPVFNEPATTTAQHVLMNKTGLTADFTVRGSGYIRILNGDEIESFTQFTLLHANKVSGELQPKVGNGENIWLEAPDFASDDMLVSMSDLITELQKPALFFADLEYHI